MIVFYPYMYGIMYIVRVTKHRSLCVLAPRAKSCPLQATYFKLYMYSFQQLILTHCYEINFMLNSSLSQEQILCNLDHCWVWIIYFYLENAKIKWGEGLNKVWNVFVALRM